MRIFRLEKIKFIVRFLRYSFCFVFLLFCVFFVLFCFFLFCFFQWFFGSNDLIHGMFHSVRCQNKGFEYKKDVKTAFFSPEVLFVAAKNDHITTLRPYYSGYGLPTRRLPFWSLGLAWNIGDEVAPPDCRKMENGLWPAIE
jgi:hypothetical protein